MVRLRSPILFLYLVSFAFSSAGAGTESKGLYGIHDHSPDPTIYLNHVTNTVGSGWVTATVAVGHNASDTSGTDFSFLANQGHTVVCRINNGYFPDGTIPVPSEYDNFARRCSNFVSASTGCAIWLIGNECNLNGEWPFNGTKFAYVSPQDYASCFRKVYNAIKAVRPNDKVISQPPAPFAGPYGASTLNGFPTDPNPLNWVQYLYQTLSAIQSSGPLDGIALHITSRGYNVSDIHSTSRVTAGGQSLSFSFDVYKDWVELGIPRSLYHLPLYATECNGYYYWKGGHPENTAAHYVAGWMQEIYAEINRYNQSAVLAGKPIFRCVNMYRWCAGCDPWNIDGGDNPYRAQILSDLDAAVAQNYRRPPTVVTRLIPAGSDWKYLDNGTDQQTAWRGTNFNDSGWAHGPAQLGFGDGDEAAVIRSNRTDTTRIITYYFRRSFTVVDPALFTNVSVYLLRDDGGVVYLNGREVFRSNMSNGVPITAASLAVSNALPNDETITFYSSPVDPTWLVRGPNVMAVEIHQINNTSSDISFDLELIGIGNSPPTVNILSPLSGAVAGASNVAFQIQSDDEDGVVSRIELFGVTSGSPVRLAQTQAPSGTPQSITWTNAAEGSHTVFAVATDSGGLRSTSAPVNITLYASLVRPGSQWKYLDDGSDQGTGWRGLAGADSAWPLGRAQLGFGDGDEATVVRGDRSDGSRIITYYFRQAFTIDDRSSYSNLLLRVLRDDGAVAYLNGNEVFRSNMPTNGAITFTTLASSAVPPEDESTHFYSMDINPGLLLPGNNLLAVEVHQANATSSDISFDAELLGMRPPPPVAARIGRSGNEVSISWPASAYAYSLQASADLFTAWSSVTNAVTLKENETSVTLAVQPGKRFFRLTR